MCMWMYISMCICMHMSVFHMCNMFLCRNVFVWQFLNSLLLEDG